MSHRDEPREVGGIYDSEQYIKTEPKKRRALTKEQEEQGQTWIFHSQPESRYVIRDEPPSTTILKPPETYRTWLPFMGPERPYVIGTHEPRKTDVTLIKAPPSVRAELRQRQYAETLAKTETSRIFGSDIQERLYGVQTRLYDIEYGLRELGLIQEQRALGFEFVEKKGGELFFVPKETKGISEALLGIHVPSLPEMLGYYVPGPPELLGFGRMEPEHYSMMEPFAGFVASFEQPVYTIGRLVGFETPRVPPGLLSGYSLEHPAYGVGAFAGEVAQAYVMGKVVTKTIVQPVSKVWKGSKSESWFIKHSEWYGKRARKGLAPQIVSFPTPEKVSVKGLEAQQFAWELMQTPKTSGVTVAKVGAKRTVFRFVRGVGYTPMSVTLAKATDVSDMGGRQAIIQVEKPLKKMPFLPKFETFAPKVSNVFSSIVGVSLTVGAQAIPKVKAKPFVSTIKMPSIVSVQKISIIQSVIQTPVSIQKTVPTQEVVQIQKNITKQITRTKMVMRAPLFPTPDLLKRRAFPEFRREQKRKRKGKGLFDAWFFKEHAVSASQLLGLPAKRKRRK